MINLNPEKPKRQAEINNWETYMFLVQLQKGDEGPCGIIVENILDFTDRFGEEVRRISLTDGSCYLLGENCMGLFASYYNNTY